MSFAIPNDDIVSQVHPVYTQSAIANFALKYVTLEHTQTFMEFAVAIWEAKPRSTIPHPSFMSELQANEAASVICQAKQEWWNNRGSVNIRDVAEIRGSRFNNGKTRYDLLDWETLQGLADVLAFGAQKYAPYNWKKGLPVTEIIASMLRHVAAISQGEDIDSETGLPHADHIQCNAMFLSWMMKNRPDMDDRHKS